MPRLRAVALVTLLSVLPACSAGDPPEQAGSSSPGTPPSTYGTTPKRLTTPPLDPRTAYIEALFAAGVPVSESQRAEFRIGEGVCAQIAAGVGQERLANDLVAGHVYTADQAVAVIGAAVLHLCKTD